jgi:NAD(P)-dependent dehydrogenase (short-subunit alcohol dehydrogenase family)
VRPWQQTDAALQVFGATGHMGRSIVKTCLSHGDNVTAVGRVGEHTLDQMQGWHDSCLGLLCDVRVSQTVASVIQNTIRQFGSVDVIVKSVTSIKSHALAMTVDLIIDPSSSVVLDMV